jgi:hypothetical protein
MSISKIPNIVADSYGGYPYSVEFSMGYSSEPSKLTYNVVSKTGLYNAITIGKASSLTFGDFKFSGKVFSYDLEESNSGNILSVTLIDESVVLDRLYVLVFRPGVFNQKGTSKNINLDVKFTDEEKKYYDIQVFQGGYKIIEKTLSDGSVQRKVRTLNKKFGDVLVVGSEEPPDTKCEIASTSYVFNDLKTLIGNTIKGFSSCPIKDSGIRKTYEGTLRSVLNSWCQDFGISFYWDYSNNSIKFIDLNKSVFSIPVSKNELITSKKTYESMEGTFNQVAIDYFAKPFNPKSLSLSSGRTSYSTFSMSSYNFERFLKRTEDGSDTLFGGGRSKQQFINSAVCGYISPTLRKIYNHSFLGTSGSHCGHVSDPEAISVTAVVDAMGLSGMADTINDLVDFSGLASAKLGTEYYFILSKYDEGLEAKWHDIEQDIFTNKIGRFYAGPGIRGGSFKFCSKSAIIDSSVTYEPEGSSMEDSDLAEYPGFKGRKIFDRGGGGPSLTQAECIEKLGLNGSDGDILEKLKPIHLELLKNSKFYTNLILGGVAQETVSKYDCILIVPRQTLIAKKIKMNASGSGGSNPKETTYSEVERNSDPNPAQCELDDPSQDACLSGKEELRKKQTGVKEDFEQRKPAEGLSSKSGIGCNISIFGKSLSLVSAANSTYRGVVTYSTSVETILDQTESESFVFNLDGNYQPSSSTNFLETRLIIENRTTAENLQKEKPTPSELSSRLGYLQVENLKKVTYSCAGFVKDLKMSPDSGLENLDLSISDGGFSCSYTYSTRPPVFGKQDLSRINYDASSSRAAAQLR